MKRAASTTAVQAQAKKPREKGPEYHETPSVRDEEGEIVWPALKGDVENARRIVRECAAAHKRTLIVPDKDADGLTSGAILHRTLTLLGLPPRLISVHLLHKGASVHSPTESRRMSAYDPFYVFVLDQGSRASPPLVEGERVALVIDHHHAGDGDFPAGAEHVSANRCPPVATSSLLTYEICKPLHERVAEETAWLCCVGTHGDLGASLKWLPPFPDMSQTLKMHTKKAVTDAVALLNAPRRTASFDVISAWDALMAACSPSTGTTSTSTPTDPPGPKRLLKDKRLLQARAEINAEVERCTHTPPKFSRDGKVAVFRIDSRCQVHPLIATRWGSHLSSKRLEFVCVANGGYLGGEDGGDGEEEDGEGEGESKDANGDGKVGGTVNFSCRVARVARERRAKEGEEPVNVIEALKAYAALADSGGNGSGGIDSGGTDSGGSDPQGSKREDGKPPLVERLGESFARGHKEASGGIVGREEFEELMGVMGVGEKVEKAEKGEGGQDSGGSKGGGGKAGKKVNGVGASPQKNTLANYFGKKG